MTRKPCNFELDAAMAVQRSLGTGAWALEVLEEDAKRLAGLRESRLGVPWNDARVWLEGWGTSDEGPPSVRRL